MRILVTASLVAGGAILSAGTAGQAWAAKATVAESEVFLRPAARPGEAQASQAQDPDTQLASAVSLRPQARPSGAAPVARTPTPAAARTDARFSDWLGAFQARARSEGIAARTLEAAFDGVSPDPDVIRRDRNQSEFSKTIWEYLDSAASASRVRNGRDAIAAQNQRLEKIEAKYGVDKEVVAAIWGLESNYGSYRGNMDVVRSLATLAFDGRRGAFFEDQLIAALKILQAGDVPPRKMTGSWAGAMGHTQFIPASYLQFAVDFTGDGKRDIWSDDPSDSLASTAAYLDKAGWVTGQPWGVEVVLPKGFDYRLADRAITRMPSDWARLGVRGSDGRAVPDHGTASILLPAGKDGTAFMIFKNFAVIERYNAADAYVIGVGHLSDRLKGGAALQGGWPRSDRALSRAEREEMQRRLTAAGFDTQGVDGRIGPNTIQALRAYQDARGLVPDGYASPAVLRQLR